MRSRAFKLLLLITAAAGGVIAWQRRNETPPLPPAEPFKDPVHPLAGSGSSGVAAGTAAPAGREAQPSASETTGSDVPASETDTAEIPTVDHLPEPAAAVEGGPADDAGVVAEASQQPLPDPPRGPFTHAPDAPADDLQRITGIGPRLAQALNEQGITTFGQLAALSEDDLEELQRRLPQFPGRVRRDDWVGQARRLAGG